jgi:hypothetical protein
MICGIGLRIRWMAAARTGALPVIMAALWLVASGTHLAAQDLEPSVNAASVIDFPTALDQPTPNILHGTFEVFDLASPDLRPTGLTYGHQWNNVEVLTDAYWQPQTRTFDYADAMAKVRAINIDAQQTYIAFGAIARWSDQPGKTETVLDNKPYSLLAILTTELYPIESWGAFLLNVYLDNRYADAGLKVQLYPLIKLVAETDYHYGDINDDPHKWRNKVGVQFDGDKNFYMQLLYDDAGNHVRVQMGTGF